MEHQLLSPSVGAIADGWVRAVVHKDFSQIAALCHPDASARVMTPRRMDELVSPASIAGKMERWFGACHNLQEELRRAAMVGERLSLGYRIRGVEDGVEFLVEQQAYCLLADARILHLDLLCSGFQPVGESALAASSPAAASQQRHRPILELTTAGSTLSTCAVLTPLVRKKLNELQSGEVLEVRVDDLDAQGDIEAWCRLTGNTLLEMNQEAGRKLWFLVEKK